MSVIKRTKTKVNIIFVIFFFMLLGLAARVYYFKVVKGEEYESKAIEQQVNKYDTVLYPSRGDVTDRNGRSLAVSVTVYNIVLDPLVLVNSSIKDADREKTLTTLSRTLDLDYDTLKNYITIDPSTGKPNANTHWKYIKKQVDRSTAETLMEEGLKGVVFEKASKREYPLSTLASHVLGFIRGDSSWGLESEYNAELSGTNGRSFIVYDGTNSAVAREIEAEDGHTLVTTIDYNMQQYAEQAVKQAVSDYNCENSAVIIMNPNTGEVYGMASSPGFNNNDPAAPLEASDTDFAKSWESMNDEEKYGYLYSTWKNFNLSSTFEPGSIFKPMVVAMALEEGVISTSDRYYCGGKKIVADRTINCNLRSGHGEQSLEEVLANSCNVALMDIGAKIGAETFYKYQKEFGIGSLTGIDLPGEVSASTLMFESDEIGPVELATMSFGQSFNVTPIQAITAFCSVINGGKLMQPYVVSQVLDADGNVISETKPVEIRRVISEETSDILRTYMKAVVDYGTGKKAKIEGYSIGGKTGTGEQGNRDDEEYTISYEAFMPVEKPEVALITIIHKPESYTDGVTSAGPITKALLADLIKYLSIEPAYDAGNNSGTVGTSASGIKIEDYVNLNLKKVTETLISKGLSYEVVGSGNKITNQAPHSGAEVEPGSRIYLYVTNGEGDSGGIKVPDVRKMTLAEAKNALYSAGFAVSSEGDDSSLVSGQSPNYGVTAENGSYVVLYTE